MLSLEIEIKNNKIDVNQEFIEYSNKFIKSLQQWNKIHNLTGSDTKEDIIENIIDSIYPLQFLPNGIETILDIGTGAGFPGIIVAMAAKNIKVILVEPRKKRVAFLHYIKSMLKLDNVEIVAKRVEEIQIDNVDCIISRAVTQVELLENLSKHLIKDKVTYLLYKGSKLEDEVKLNTNHKRYERNKRVYLIYDKTK